MEVLTLLQNYGGLNIVAVIGIVAIMGQMRKYFLDSLILKIKYGWVKWLMITLSALIVSLVITFIILLKQQFNLLEWAKMASLNWVFSWVFHDTIKNLFFKEDNNKNDQVY